MVPGVGVVEIVAVVVKEEGKIVVKVEAVVEVRQGHLEVHPVALPDPLGVAGQI